MLLSNLMFGPLLSLCDPIYLTKMLKQAYYWKRLREGLLDHFTQKEVNAMFEPPDVNIDVRYCNVVRTYLVTAFFFDMCPLVVPLCLCYLLVQFWVDKYLFLRRSKRIRRYHPKLAIELNENAEYAIFLLIVGSIAFKFKANKSVHVLDFCLLGIASLLLFVPLKKFSERRDHHKKVIEDYHAEDEEKKHE